MPIYKCIRCVKCDSVVLAHMPFLKVPASGDTSLCQLDCPECKEVTIVMLAAGGLQRYSMPDAAFERGYVKKGEWQTA